MKGKCRMTEHQEQRMTKKNVMVKKRNQRTTLTVNAHTQRERHTKTGSHFCTFNKLNDERFLYTQNKLYIFIAQYTPLAYPCLFLLCCFFFSMSLRLVLLGLATFRISVHRSLHFNARCVICQEWASEHCFVFFVQIQVSGYYSFIFGRKCADICRNRQLQSS